MNELPQRKNIRLKYYNYAEEGYYFITICTKNKMNLLGEIKLNDDNNVGVAALGDPNQYQMFLSKYGEIAKKHLEEYNKNFFGLKIDEYTIMPNHIHMIIVLNGSPGAATPTIPKIINSYKSIVSRKIGYSIWQRNYYEHIIRNDKEYYEIRKYIQNNVANWALDKYYK